MVVLEEKIFKIKALRLLERAILKLDFTNTVCRKSALSLIFEAGFTESGLVILFHPESTIGATMVGPEDRFLTMSSQIVGKRYLEIGFCKYSMS